MVVVQKALDLARYFEVPFFLENPHSGLLKTRDVVRGVPMRVIDYCVYADDDWPGRYRKRTSIWTNTSWQPARPLCIPSACHFCTDGVYICGAILCTLSFKGHHLLLLDALVRWSTHRWYISVILNMCTCVCGLHSRTSKTPRRATQPWYITCIRIACNAYAGSMAVALYICVQSLPPRIGRLFRLANLRAETYIITHLTAVSLKAS